MVTGPVVAAVSPQPRGAATATTTQEANVPIQASAHRLLAVAAGAVAVLSLAGPAAAKESAGVFSSAPTTTTTTCTPIQSEKISGVTNTGDSNLASITVDYQVKPCDSKQVVTVETLMTDYYDSSVVLWDDPAASQSGRFTVYGVAIAHNYRVTIIVRDAATGATVVSVDRLANVPRPTGV
jgi:hypothetical protein